MGLALTIIGTVAAALLTLIILLFGYKTAIENAGSDSNKDTTKPKGRNIWSKNRPYIFFELVLLVITLGFIFYKDISLSEIINNLKEEVRKITTVTEDWTETVPAPELLVKFLGEGLASVVVWTVVILVACYIIAVISRLLRGRKEAFSPGLFGRLLVFIGGVLFITLVVGAAVDALTGGEEGKPVELRKFERSDGSSRRIVIPVNGVIKMFIPIGFPGKVFYACSEIIEPKKIADLGLGEFEPVEKSNNSSIHMIRLTKESLTELMYDYGVEKMTVKVTIRSSTPGNSPC